MSRRHNPLTLSSAGALRANGSCADSPNPERNAVGTRRAPLIGMIYGIPRARRSVRPAIRRIVMAGTGPIELAVVVLCVVLSAFFSSSEAAFLSVQRTARLAHLVQEGVPAARRVSRMLANPGRLLSTILLGNNVVNVAFTAITTALILDVISDQGTGLVVATVVGTATLLILGESYRRRSRYGFRWA